MLLLKGINNGYLTIILKPCDISNGNTLSNLQRSTIDHPYSNITDEDNFILI